MKVLLAISLLFTFSQAMAHGKIEDITCTDAKEKITLKGTETPNPNVLAFTIQKGKTQVLERTVARLKLEDKAIDGKVYEIIDIALGKPGDIQLTILEDYKKEVRPGTGKLKYKSAKTDNLDCLVTY